MVDGGFIALEQAQHLALGAQALFGVGKGRASQLIDAAMGANGGQHIDKTATLGCVHDRRRTGHRRDAEGFGKCRQIGKTRAILPVIAGRDQQTALTGKAGNQAAGVGLMFQRRSKQHLHACAPFHKVAQVEQTLALYRPQPPL